MQFAEASVDIETGIVKVTRILAIQDCGLIVDKLTAESQVYGGIIARDQLRAVRGSHSRSRHRPDGEPEHGVYLLAGMSDVPKIDIMLNNMPERGVIGIGEPPTVSTASAIANAVRNATGATIRSLPLHPHKVLAAIEQEKSRRDAVKAFAYVNPANEKDAVAALKVEAASPCRSPAARTCSRG